MAAGPAILVIGPNWVGDMVMAGSLVATLRGRFPDQPIDVLAPPATAPIAARMPEVRRAIEFRFSPHRPALEERWRLARTLLGQYSTAYVLPGSWISALIPALAGIPVRVGYLRELRYGLLNRIVAMPGGQKRKTADAYFRLAGANGSRQPPLLAVDQDNQRRLLAGHRLAQNGFVTLVPGAEGGSAKRWPAARYADLARLFMREGRAVVLMGGPRDATVTAEVAAAAPGAMDLGGKTTLADAVDLIAAAQLAVANDSGLMHVAAAVGTPVVGIYGSTSPGDTPPLSERAAPVWRGLACSPCNHRECPLGHTDCLNGIGAAQVLDTAQRLIAAASAA